MTREQISILESKLLANIDQLEYEFGCIVADRARYDVERTEIRDFCSWARLASEQEPAVARRAYARGFSAGEESERNRVKRFLEEPI